MVFVPDSPVPYKEIDIQIMAASRRINQNIKLRLFADAAGFCQNPSCLQPLFSDKYPHSHIAEIAHIIAASDYGPRANVNLEQEYRVSYDNLLLLCPSCHTKVDKAPEKYLCHQLSQWKRNHTTKIAGVFSLNSCNSREEARKLIEPFMKENLSIFTEHGPNNEYRFDPESEQAWIWKRKVLSIILPNNRKILMILDKNRNMLSANEKYVLEEYRQHVEEMEERHLGDAFTVGRQYPPGMQTIFIGDE